ncbi:hypothetical protein EZV62_007518 [Acer yangbiense]|uniref:DUF7903 domain-containing protein n=1 Tax=Acer yangbiense TaxID=1000413 RepID=A0A5C7I9S0_9ROSI|nr:hypothetical protein EZV62_007518 [Acer yangbiense]
MPSPIPERLVPQFSRQVNLKSSSNANARNVSSVRSMYIVGLDADNQFPSSVHLVPTSIESFKQRMYENPLVLVNSHPATKVHLGNLWQVDVWPKLLSAFEIVRDMLESNDELDEVKPAIYARLARFSSIRMNASLSDGTKPKNYDIYCKCRMNENKKLELYKVETNPVYEMIKNILRIGKNIDLRLALQTKRILTSLTDDEMHSIRNIINSAIIDPEVKGGLRWPYGKACSGDRFAVVNIWHTIAKKYKSRSLSLMARRVVRFDFRNAYGEDSIEVNLKLKRLVSNLQEEKVEMDSIFEMFKDNLKMIWVHFFCCDQYFP